MFSISSLSHHDKSYSQMKKEKAEGNERGRGERMGESDGMGRKERFWRAADSVKACDLSIRQHFLRAKIVVIADQAQCLTFILIARDDRMSSAQDDSPGSPKINRQPSFVSVCLRKSTNCPSTTARIIPEFILHLLYSYILIVIKI